eukprot:CAMPEP_0181206626 /NCGR_PEP_ID=MMETSP1096-20121128/21135_1 /TAXON_ID=156174 ORGANISM="Chrysochromulina ericina, Strain CCMP281" /NCGR_SAMPLE_ID=MMETSP1096 /ASSEMBLY_ACC=CAM_ASM_000453 /LENGTH=127 /DNA_ID=CAMNT_0023297537 /DNA_START=373 /DNA_END=757 /DNA_ORIENTATION=-
MLASPPGMVWRGRAAHRLPVAASTGALAAPRATSTVALPRGEAAQTGMGSHGVRRGRLSAEAADWLLLVRPARLRCRGARRPKLGREATGREGGVRLIVRWSPKVSGREVITEEARERELDVDKPAA